MATVVKTDWYKYPYYYDVVFDGDTPYEVDFLEAAFKKYGKSSDSDSLKILEPACGTGRLMFELASRGHHTVGFDLSEEMIEHVHERAKREPTAIRKRVRAKVDSMQSFRQRGPFDLAFCLLSTFKYLLTEKDALACLKRMARTLSPGGIFVLGLHLTDYSRRTQDRETWKGNDDSIYVHCETVTKPADREARLEWLRNRLRIRQIGKSGSDILETNWQCRTYDAAELKALIAKVPELKIAGCHDFTHDINIKRKLDDSQEDIVVILRKSS